MPRSKTPRTQLRLVVGIRDVANHFEVSTRSITNWVERGEFPEPYRVGGRLLRWDVSALNAWIESGCPAVTDEVER